MSAYISDFKNKNEEHLCQAITDVEVMNQFRIKNQELDEIKQILNK